MKHQHLIGLIVGNVLLLRFSPLQRNMSLESFAITQYRPLLQIFADCLRYPPDLFMRGRDD